MPESRFYKDRADAERMAAATALPQIRNRHLRAAEVWDRMAEKAETTRQTRQSNESVRQEQIQLVHERAKLRVRVRRVA